MSASRRHHGHDDDHEGGHDEGERWLVSFADMMTLLFALFMVLFSISSVNTSKLDALQKSLQDAFSGKVLSGGKAIMETGSETKQEKSAATPPLPALSPIQAATETDQSAKGAQKEQEEFYALKRRVDKLAENAGLKGHVLTTVRQRGLVIQLLTDNVFFDSGQATIKPEAYKLLDKIAVIVRDEHKHPVVVEGHTDSQPIGGSQYPSNWELSGARAAAVVRDFAANGVLSRRLSFSGYADEEPIATNSTVAGRSRNRRVEVVLSRINTPTSNSITSDKESGASAQGGATK
jgi:chemotaxis protein MotB